MLGNFTKSLIAVLAGNALYFLLLAPNLPPAAQHRPGRLDLGLVIDFWTCLALFGLLELFLRRRQARRLRPGRHSPPE